MSAKPKRMVIGGFMEGPGRTWSDWKHPNAQPDAFYNLNWLKRSVEVFEKHGHYDYVFIADSVGMSPTNSAPYTQCRLEPLSIMAALAACTEHIGLAATLSTSFTEPYNAARLFASLDHLSGGRAAFNVVTSYSALSAVNFGLETMMDHEKRYRRAEEFLDVCQELWDSWEDDAMVHDKKAGIYSDFKKIHKINHRGEFFQVAGPLNICRPPQGNPVIFQAGSSDTGRSFAARRADCIFVSPYSIDQAKEFTRDIKARAKAAGRDPDKVYVVPSVTPFVGLTEAEAEAKYQERAGLVDIGDALLRMTKYFDGHDFTRYDLDKPLPDILSSYINGFQGSVQRIVQMAKADNLSLRQIAMRVGSPKGDFIGTPVQIADLMEKWVDEGACDGFMLMEGLPGEHMTFIQHVLPILQDRGRFRREYEGKTLRDNLGLDRPPSRYAQGWRDPALQATAS